MAFYAETAPRGLPCEVPNRREREAQSKGLP